MPKAQGNFVAEHTECEKRPNERTKEQSNKSEIFGLTEVDYVTPSAKLTRHDAVFYIFDDNEAVIKMIIRGRSQTMRHVSRIHRVAPDWLFDRINHDPKIQNKNVDTRNQLADILTKGAFHS